MRMALLTMNSMSYGINQPLDLLAKLIADKHSDLRDQFQAKRRLDNLLLAANSSWEVDQAFLL